jgi:uncharacterized protein (DUF2147 family)
MRRIALFLLLAVVCAPLMAQNQAASPAGRWKTIDDATGHAKAIVVLTEQNGVLSGSIERVLETDQPGPNPVCLKCEGELKNRPLAGLRILWKMKRDGNQWTGGQILDPHSGKIYRCIIAVADGGKTLKVRGFIGVALLGRTQLWQRID